MLELSSDVAVIVTSPAATAVTFQFASTEATSLLLLDQLTHLYVASLGAIVATNVSSAQISKVTSSLFKAIPVTAIFSTLTVQVACAYPLVAVITMFSPSATPVTTPFTTVALLLLEEDQVIGKDAQAGVNEAVSVKLFQTLTVLVTSLKVIASGYTGCCNPE